MAYEQHMKYVIDYEANKQSLNKLKQQLQELSDLTSPAYGKLNNMSIKEAYKELTKIRENIVTVENALARAFNPKINTVNIQKFKEELASSGLTLTQIRQSFNKMGVEGKQAYISLQSQIFKTNKVLKETPKFLSKIGQTFTNVVSWNLSSAAINTVVGSIQKAWGFAKELDSSLNDIRIVTGQSASEMAKFANQANKAAQQLGRTTTDYTNASLIFAQQGLNEKERKARTQITLKAANVTGQSAQQVSEELTAVWNGYKATAEQAEIYVDRLTAVAAHSASNLQELSTGMSKVAAAAASLGVGEDQLAAQLATIISVTRQAPETVGTALKTVYARITDIKAGVEEDGTTLGMYSEKLADMGINVLDTAGNLRNMGEVIEEVGGKWEKFSKEQQIYIAQTMAGQRQYSNLVSLFDNFDKYNDAMKVAGEAAGTLQKQQEVYMESTDAKLQKIQSTLEKTFNTIMDSSAIKTLLDFLNSLAGVLSDVVNALGGSGGLLSILGVLGTTAIVNKGSEFLSSTIKNFKAAKFEATDLNNKIKEVNEQLNNKNLTSAQKEQLKRQKEIYSMQQRYRGIMTNDDLKKLQDDNKRRVELEEEIEYIRDSREKVFNKITKEMGSSTFETSSDQKTKEVSNIKNVGEFVNQYKESTTVDKVGLRNTVSNYYQNKIKDYEALFQTNFEEINNDQYVDKIFKKYTEGIKEAIKKIKDLEERKEAYHKYFQGLDKNSMDQVEKDISSAFSLKKSDNFFRSLGNAFNTKEKDFINFLKNQVRDGEAAKINSKKSGLLEVTKKLDFLGEEEKNIYSNKIIKANNEKELKEIYEDIQKAVRRAKTDTEEFQKTLEETMGARPEMAEKEKKEIQQRWKRLQEGLDTKTFIQSLSEIVKGVAELSFGFSQFGKNLKEITTGVADLISYGGDLKNLTAIVSTAISSGISLYQGWNSFSKGMRGLQNNYDAKLLKSGNLKINTDDDGNEISRTYIDKNGKANTVKGQQLRGFAAKAGAIAMGISIAATFLNTLDEFSKIRNEQIQKQIEQNNKLIESEREKQQEIKSEQDVIKTVQNLNKQYQEGTISAVELRNKTKELQQQYKDSSAIVKDLVSNYTQLNAALLRAKQETADKLIESKRTELNLLKANVSMQNEGKEYNTAGAFGGVNLASKLTNATGGTSFVAGLGDNGESKRLGAILKAKNQGGNLNATIPGHPLLEGILNFVGISTGSYLSDAKNNIEAYEQFKTIQQYINSTVDEQKNTDTYKQAVQYYEEMKPMIEEWKTASLEQLNLIAERTALDYTQSFNGVNSFESYVSAYESVINKEYAKLKDEQSFIIASDEERKNILLNAVESIIPDDLKNKYGVKQDIINRIMFTQGVKGVSYGSSASDIVAGLKDIINTINQIPQETLAKISIDIEGTSNLKAVKNQLEIVKNYDFTPLHWNPADIANSAEIFDKRQNAIDKIQSNKGMSDKEFKEWVPESEQKNFWYSTKGWVVRNSANISDQDVIQHLRNSAFSGQDGYGSELKSFNKAIGVSNYLNLEKNQDLKKTLLNEDESIFSFDAQNLTEEQADAVKDYINKIDTMATANKIGQYKTKTEALLDEIEASEGIITEKIYAHFQDLANTVRTDLKANEEDLARKSQKLKEIYANMHEFQVPTDEDIDLKSLKELGNQYQIAAEKGTVFNSIGKKLSSTLKDNAHGAQELAKSVLRYNSAITDVLSNYSSWMDTLSTGGLAEQIALLPQLQDAYGDLLNVNATALPQSFLASAENLQLMRQALLGSSDAYEQLRVKAIESVKSLLPKDSLKAFNDFEEVITTAFEGKEIGEKLDKDQLKEFKEKLQEFVEAAGLTADQINLILESIGENGIATDLSYDPEKGTINVGYVAKGYSGKDKYDLGEHKSEQELARDRLKNQKELTKYLKEQADLYHNINIELKQMQKEYSKLQKKQSGLMGIELLQNLRAQNKALDDQNKKLETKQKIEEKDIQRQQQRLAGMGVSFDANGNISNYNAMFDAYQGSVNEVISQIRALENRQNQLVDLNQTDSDQYKNIDANLSALNREKNRRNEDFNDFKDYVSKYDSLIDQHYETMDAIEENASKQISLNLQEFQAKVQIKLDLKQAEVDWNNFVNDVLNREDILNPNVTKRNQNIVKTAKDNNLNYVDQVNETYSAFQLYRHEAEEFRKAREQGREYESKYFHSESEAIAAMEESAEKLKDLTSNSAENIDKIKQAILDEYAEIGQVFSVNDARYEFINEQLGHDKNLIDLMEGARGGRSKDRFYTQIAENNTSRVQSLKAQADFWKSQMNDENEAVRKMAEENWKATIQSLNQATEQGLNNLKEKYENMIDTIGQEFEDSITNGHGFDYFEMEWGAIKERSEMYLDSVNSAFAIKNTQFFYQKAINDASGLKTQQQLKKVMNEQLNILKSKDKLTKYDVDRAQKVLEVEKARLALEEARYNKTTLRLKRDSSGNYSYQFTADQQAIDEAQNKLDKAKNDLYNFDLEAFYSNTEKAIAVYKDAQAKIEEIWKNQQLSREQKLERIALIQQQAEQKMTFYTGQNVNIRANLQQSAFDSLSDTFDKSKIDFEKMIYGWKSDSQSFIQKFAGPDADNVKQQFKNAIDEMSRATQQYKNDTNQYLTEAGEDYQRLKNEGIDPVVESEQKAIDNVDALMKKINTMVSNIETWKTDLNGLASAFEGIATKATDAKDSIEELKKSISQDNEDKKDDDNKGDQPQPPSTATTLTAGGADNLIQTGNQEVDNVADEGKTKVKKEKEEKESITINEDIYYLVRKGESFEQGRFVNPIESHPGAIDMNVQNMLKASDPHKKNDNDYFNLNTAPIETIAEIVSKNPNSVTSLASGGKKKFYNKYKDALVDYYIQNISNLMTEDNYDRYHESFSEEAGQEIYNNFYDLFNLISVLSTNKTQGEKKSASYLLNSTLATIHDNLLTDKKLLNYLRKSYDDDTIIDEGAINLFRKDIIKKLKNDLSKFDTGGYTGAWSSSAGKLAVLHEKELVLNKEDTKNMLDMLKITRDNAEKMSSMVEYNTILQNITDNLNDLVQLTTIGQLQQKMALTMDSAKKDADKVSLAQLEKQQAFEQQVKIEANFPNVNSKEEIEQAFADLTNLAVQKAMNLNKK